MKNQFDKAEYELMAGILEYMVKKGLAKCRTQDGRIIDREMASAYLVANHGAFCNNQ
jgi:hypothetical protein